ncbi:uncharacterized protein SCHCODRAFT_02561635 [Schizophyllum commune H4-8]|uniref:Uncharacterized protein n=1 Tax=Schizophyllum commune (strain H4-8 / FGSC 9210) TaxID=578458 RepID=D8PWQ1_SCHCM|nr:uncharacterized protein SCHCODRAFT_02561635 [Schizophyllum commune H4-8]KAI5899861.1 hypothetical protein SCHCODRAFT_02561635 [Schizophyllum commune H4-8]
MSAVAHGYHQGVLEDVMFRETAQTLPWVGEGALWMAGGALDAANSRATPNHIDHSGIPLGLPVNIRRLNLVRDADGFYENGPISTTLEPDTESSVEERQADNDGGSKNKRGRRAGKSEHRKRAREARRAAQVGDSIAAGIAPRSVDGEQQANLADDCCSSFPATRGGMRRTQSLTSLNRLSRIFDDEVTALMSINKNESSARSKPTTRGAEDRYAEKENMRPNASMLNNGGKSLSRARLPISRENMVPQLNEWSRWAGEPPRSESLQSGIESPAEDVASVATKLKGAMRVNRGEQFPAMSLSYTVTVKRNTEGYCVKRCVDGFIELFASKENVAPMHLVALDADRTEWRPIPNILVTDPEGFVKAAKIPDAMPVVRCNVPLILVEDPDGFVTKVDIPDGEPTHKTCTKVAPEDPAEETKVHDTDRVAAAVPMQERGRERERNVVSQRRPRGARSGKKHSRTTMETTLAPWPRGDLAARIANVMAADDAYRARNRDSATPEEHMADLEARIHLSAEYDAVLRAVVEGWDAENAQDEEGDASENEENVNIEDALSAVEGDDSANAVVDAEDAKEDAEDEATEGSSSETEDLEEDEAFKRMLEEVEQCRMIKEMIPPTAQAWIVPYCNTTEGQLLSYSNGWYDFAEPDQRAVPLYRHVSEWGFSHWRTIPTRIHDRWEFGSWEAFMARIGWDFVNEVADPQLLLREEMREDRADWLEYWEEMCHSTDLSVPSPLPPAPQGPPPPPPPDTSNKENERPPRAVPIVGTRPNGARRPLSGRRILGAREDQIIVAAPESLVPKSPPLRFRVPYEDWSTTDDDSVRDMSITDVHRSDEDSYVSDDDESSVEFFLG